MVSSLSMNRMARMLKMLEPIGRPSFWRKTRLLNKKYMLFSVTVRRSIISSLVEWSIWV